MLLAIASVVFLLPLFVYLFLCTIFKETDGSKITQLETEMFHDESWKPICFGQKVKDLVHESQNRCWHGSLHSCECWLLLVNMVKCNILKRPFRQRHSRSMF